MHSLINYGVEFSLAKIAEDAGLTITSIKATSSEILQSKYGLSPQDAATLRAAVRRNPIPQDTVNALIGNSLAACNVCLEGEKFTPWFIIHHIIPYEDTQDNSYKNLIILCPNHHVSAHNTGGQTHAFSKSVLRDLKKRWESEVAARRRHRAAGQFIVSRHGLDYVNPSRLEEFCSSVIGSVPKTTRSSDMMERKILNRSGMFDELTVRTQLSNGNFLFDFIGGGDRDHWRELLEALGTRVEFHDLNKAACEGKQNLKALEGQFALFTGEAKAEKVNLPAFEGTITMTAHLQEIGFEWVLNSKYIQSRTAVSRMGSLNKYAIYGYVRQILDDDQCNRTRVSSIPLLIAAPAGLVAMSNIPDIELSTSTTPDPVEMSEMRALASHLVLDANGATEVVVAEVRSPDSETS